MKKIRVQGVNADIDTNAEDVASQGGDVFFPAAVAATTIVSSSTDDDGAPVGTGARTVRVEGLDASGNPISEDATLNGTTLVTLTKQYFRVNKFEVLTVGSGGAAAGKIDVKHSSDVLSSIAIGDNVARQAVYTVPRSDRHRIIRASLKMASAPTGSVTMLVQTRKSGEPWKTRATLFVNDTISLHDKEDLSILLETLEDVRLRASSSANNTGIAASFEMEATSGQF